MDKAAPLDRYAAAQTIYSENWQDTAQYHQEAGYYDWMAAQLEPFAPRKILDIGCGTGQGLIAMFKHFDDLSVVAIDENPSCLDLAATALAHNGVHAEVIKRLVTELSPAGYAQRAAPIQCSVDQRCALIESDLCNDEHLLPYLDSIGKIDALTVWLTGHHALRQANVAVRSHGIASEGAHRLYVQNAAYELADKVLKPGGVLQIVDRGQALTSSMLRDDLLAAHRDQASPTTLEVQPEIMASLPYQPPSNNQTALIWTSGVNAPAEQPTAMELNSVISVKK